MFLFPSHTFHFTKRKHENCNVRGLHVYEPINGFKLEPNAIVKIKLGRRENGEVLDV